MLEAVGDASTRGGGVGECGEKDIPFRRGRSSMRRFRTLFASLGCVGGGCWRRRGEDGWSERGMMKKGYIARNNDEFPRVGYTLAAVLLAAGFLSLSCK